MTAINLPFQHHNSRQEPISRHTLLWLLLANVAIITPLYEQVTLWSLIICTFCLMWRFAIFAGKIARPSRKVVVAIALGSIIALLMAVKQLGMLAALINLLVLGYALKFIELKSRRDVHISVLAGYFLIALTFIKYQSLWSTLHLVIVTLVNTAVLVSLYHNENRLRFTSMLTSKIILQSFPLAILLFIVIPRLPPLWMVPSQGGAVTGLSDSVNFTNITKLTRSSALAFRATFDNKYQADNKDLYWRAIVLEDYDNQQWSQNSSITEHNSIKAGARKLDFNIATASQQIKPQHYAIIAEPSAQQWLFGLDVAASKDPSVIMRADHSLYSKQVIDTAKQYQLMAFPNLEMELALDPTTRAINLALPKNSNPQTTALAMQFKLLYPDAKARLNAMMRYFTEQPYFYTLQPPAVGEQQIDDFLIINKAGFCVHYASAFTFMARTTGLPARLVTGYQGGEYNGTGGYYSIYQYMAHAWVEVWLPSLGWTRYDPTSMIAPQRINAGFDAYFDPFESYRLNSPLGYLGLYTSEWFNQLRLQLASIDYFWSVWVLGFDTDKQQNVLKKLLGEITQTRLALLVLASLLIIGLAIAYSAGLLTPTRTKAKHIQAYLTICNLLAKRSLPRHTDETPEHYNQRVSTYFPAIAKDFDCLTRYYVAIQYQPLSSSAKKRVSRLLIRQSWKLKINIITLGLALNKTNT
ncbi:transglutaminase TgpA family protein [Shewanella youngdeokensis]|uniref:DUF3488 and transglutaminase-like domain-containing protein n=1 Tax=Shewanella youngdeokensis TaxID=2999068 RepID=A0ABZ0JTV0_9GAMM|nr:DUF3488 and transglutaminase-like domain-containing protein [Shewanella sp. DAU334]